jgi:hypothetical protein
MQAADLADFRHMWPMAADNTLLIAFPREQLYGKAPAQLIGLLLDALPVHTVLLSDQSEPQLRKRVRQHLHERWSLPIFLDSYARNTDEVLYGSRSEVRVVVTNQSEPVPQLLWLSDCALQVVFVASDLPDVQHPLRRLLDTRAHINYEDFIDRLIG